jgi:hypothetical protein
VPKEKGAMVTGARTDTQFAAHKSNIISNNNNTKKKERNREMRKSCSLCEKRVEAQK